MVYAIVGVLFVWILLGTVFASLINESTKSNGLEFVNPLWLYKRFKVNWFGATMITLAFNILVLPYAICYWFYKLCTVGRKDKDEI